MIIWKFKLPIADIQVMEIPEINRPLAVQWQDGSGACLWAIVDPTSPRIKVRVRTFATGHDGIAAGMDYLGTYQHIGLVFHVFIEGREPATQEYQI